MEELKNPEITQEIVLKLHREQSCYKGFAWIGIKELIGTNEKVDIEFKTAYHMVIYKHLVTGQVFGTPIRITTGLDGIGYRSLIEKTSRLSELEEL